MNIALFSDTFYPEVNGVATSVNSLFTLLNERGHNCYVITTTSSKYVTYKDKVIGIPGIELKQLYGYRAAFVFNNDAFKLIKSLNLDVVHVNTEFGIGQFGFIVAKKLNIASVYTYHTMYEDYTYYATKGYFDRFSKWAIREFARACMIRATEIISPSAKTEVYLRSIGLEKMINIVPTGFDFSRFEVDDKEMISKLKKEYGLDKYDKILLCLGRIAKEKSFDIIIEGYKGYLDKYKDSKIKTILIFVGAGPDENNLIKLTKDLGIDNNVLFLGKVNLEKVPYYYAMSDIFLNASISETQGLTFVEAMAAHIPILCRYDNNLVNVINNKVTGFFFEDMIDFKDKLNEVINMKKEEMDEIVKNAYNSISQFSDNTFYNNIMEVYKRAIRKNW